MDACPRRFFRVKIFCTRLAIIVATLCFSVWNRKQPCGIRFTLTHRKEIFGSPRVASRLVVPQAAMEFLI